MEFPIAIEPSTPDHAFSVVVPDLPGCFSAGDTLAEAVANAKEAIELWIATVRADGGVVPAPKTIGEHYGEPEFSGWTWLIVAVKVE
jgi:predicted RNase H-like HicB family nuclease